MEEAVKPEEEVQQGVGRLEAEIDRAVGLSERLRREQYELENHRKEFQDQFAQPARDLTELRNERDRLQKVYEDNASLIDHREEIQLKIETMLSRLDAVNSG